MEKMFNGVIFVFILLFGGSRSFYQRRTLNQKDGANFCRLQSNSFFQNTVQGIFECAVLWEAFNHQPDFFIFPSEFFPYYSQIISNHTLFHISKQLNDQVQSIKFFWDSFYLHLQSYPFFPFLYNPYHLCQGFNFLSTTNTCQLFHSQQNPPMLVNVSQCTYFIKVPFGSCLLKICRFHDVVFYVVHESWKTVYLLMEKTL